MADDMEKNRQQDGQQSGQSGQGNQPGQQGQKGQPVRVINRADSPDRKRVVRARMKTRTRTWTSSVARRNFCQDVQESRRHAGTFVLGQHR